MSALSRGRPAVFLDRDGTLIDDVGFVSRRQDVRLLPTVAAALATLAQAGYARVVVTNQSGVGRGYFSAAAVHEINAEILTQLEPDAGGIEAFYHCPHFEADCECRKPEPGMIVRAAQEHDIDIARSVVVGDRGSDIELGQRLGIPGVLVAGPIPYAGPEPDFRAQTLLEAANWIVRHGT